MTQTTGHVSPTARQVLDRLRRAGGSPLYVSEIAQGTSLEESQVHDALVELESHGLVEPRTWRLTDEGKAA